MGVPQCGTLAPLTEAPQLKHFRAKLGAEWTTGRKRPEEFPPLVGIQYQDAYYMMIGNRRLLAKLWPS